MCVRRTIIIELHLLETLTRNNLNKTYHNLSLFTIGGMLKEPMLDYQKSRSVWKFHSNNLNNPPSEMPSMVYGRYGAACAVFNSSLHGGRPVLIVVGSGEIKGSGWSASKTAEILDYTVSGASWQESNFIF